MNPKSLVLPSDEELLEKLYQERNAWWIQKGRLDVKINALELKLNRRDKNGVV